ncbi:MAG: Transcriptional regulator, MerR family [uncultured Thermomicrobiales bacterium]|uniref:Transcriptional regulator, MerR family n=1 Tax=uncultured Thermomicrobiales bacterium TaxID=1645740 RepID=A0A6J4UXV8_9BACT|nr:MAG: Transcriptional regulator, MerR family [uncultured Thermomicrobiales bacterium]
MHFDRLKSDPVYNTRAVVQRTGVPADTFRAWERRYGVPRPMRTAGNQRLYSERDVATIGWLRDRTREGLTISQAVALFRSEEEPGVPPSISEALDAVRGGRVSPPVAGERLAAFRDEVVEALVGFDAARADRAVEEAIALLPVEDVCLHVLQAVLVEIGERWVRGEVGISSEHYASHFVMRKIGTLFNLSQPESGRGPLVAACPEGELHEVGLLLTCLFLSRRGYRIVYLGANLPLADLLDTVERIRPAMVLLSTSTWQGAQQLIAASREIDARVSRDGLSGQTVVGFGGHIFLSDPDLREKVAGVFLGQNADEAIRAVDQAVAGIPAPVDAPR